MKSMIGDTDYREEEGKRKKNKSNEQYERCGKGERFERWEGQGGLTHQFGNILLF